MMPRGNKRCHHGDAAPRTDKGACKICRAGHARKWLLNNLSKNREKCRIYGQSKRNQKLRDQALSMPTVNIDPNRRRKDKKNKIQLKRNAAVKASTPKWLNKEIMKIIYENCPPGHHVDHIIPLRGKTVCGLHVFHNLQYLDARTNIKKHNKLLGQ